VLSKDPRRTPDFAESFAAVITGDPQNMVGETRKMLIQITLDLIVTYYPYVIFRRI